MNVKQCNLKKRFNFNYLTAACLGFLACSTPQKPAQETAPKKTHPPARCVSLWDQSIANDLQTFLDPELFKQAKRTISYRALFPENQTELVALNRMAILGIRIYQKDIKKPKIFTKAYAIDKNQKGKIDWLPTIFPKVKTVQTRYLRNPQETDALLLHLQEFYVFVPIRSLKAEGSLALRFENETDMIKFEKLPLQNEFFSKDFVVADAAKREDPEIAPDPGLVVDKLSKAFCW